MYHFISRTGFSRLCSRCGTQLRTGDCYWYINGETICTDCLDAYARAELEPFRRVWGEEASR